MIKEDKIQNKIELIKKEIWKKIIWQSNLIRDLLISLFSGWHILIEWFPWLAKTLSIDTLSKTLWLKFKRIQFTPDLLPSDLLWANIYNPNKKDFDIKFWPIFSNFVLADEINRAPSKVQSALLEAMAEKQVTIWDKTYKLDEPFIVLATQNPIEQMWVYSLPEAELDRFLLKTVITYPTKNEEINILENSSFIDDIDINKILTKKEVLEIKNKVKHIYVDKNILTYISDIIFETRNIEKYKDLISYWVSPRASISLLNSAKTLAFLNNRDFVIPEDIKEMATPVLRHRIILTYEANADDISVDFVIEKILSNIKIK